MRSAIGIRPAPRQPGLQLSGHHGRRYRNSIAVFGSPYSWHLAGGSWRTAASLPAGSSGGLVAADPAGTFVYTDRSGNAFTFAAGATSFGTGSGSRGSLGDLKIVPGRAAMLAANAVSTETVS